MANNSNMQFWTLETKEKRMNLRKRCFESMLSRSTVTQMFGYQSLQIRYLDMTKVRIWGAGIETTSVSLSRWRCSCCAWEERWCTARVGEKGRSEGKARSIRWRMKRMWRSFWGSSPCGWCRLRRSGGLGRRSGELWAKHRAMRVSVERKGRCDVGWCSGIIWRRSAIRSDFSLASLNRPLRIGEGSNECLLDNNSCCTMSELGIIDYESENAKSGHFCAFVLKM